MLKATKDTTFSGAVATVEAYFEGPAVPVTYSLVNGSKSFNNSDFTINSTTGEISLTSTQALGNYYARYRVTRDDRPEEFVEGNLRLSIAPETAPTVNDITLSSGLVADEVVGVAVTTFNNSPEFELQMNTSLGANPAPESAAGDFKIGPVGEVTPGEAQIKWTGRGSQSNEYDYAYTALCRDGQCFSGSTEFDIYHNVPLSGSLGTQIGPLCVSTTYTAPLNVSTYELTPHSEASFDAMTALIRTDSVSTSVPSDNQPDFGYRHHDADQMGIFRGMFKVPAAELSNEFGATELYLGVQNHITRTNASWITYLYTTTEPTGANKAKGMQDWTLIDTLLTDNGGGQAMLTFTGLPFGQDFWIGGMSKEDYDDDYATAPYTSTNHELEFAYSTYSQVQHNVTKAPTFKGAGSYSCITSKAYVAGGVCNDQGEFDALLVQIRADAISAGAYIHWVKWSGDSGPTIPNGQGDYATANPTKFTSWEDI